MCIRTCKGVRTIRTLRTAYRAYAQFAQYTRTQNTHTVRRQSTHTMLLLKLLVFVLSMSYFDFFSLSSFCLAFGGFSRQPGHFPYISAQTQTRLLTRVVVL